MSKLVAEFLGTYRAVIHGQEVEVKKYGSPKLCVSEHDKTIFNKYFKEIDNYDKESE